VKAWSLIYPDYSYFKPPNIYISMQLSINGERTSLENVTTITELLNHLNLQGKIAIEVNREIVPRSQFNKYQINDGDLVEIVHAIGGG